MPGATTCKPGITGWAQVNGLRGETDTDEKMHRRVEHDLHYIDNWSLWLDLRILVMTLFSRACSPSRRPSRTTRKRHGRCITVTVRYMKPSMVISVQTRAS